MRQHSRTVNTLLVAWFFHRTPEVNHHPVAWPVYNSSPPPVHTVFPSLVFSKFLKLQFWLLHLSCRVKPGDSLSVWFRWGRVLLASLGVKNVDFWSCRRHGTFSPVKAPGTCSHSSLPALLSSAGTFYSSSPGHSQLPCSYHWVGPFLQGGLSSIGSEYHLAFLCLLHFCFLSFTVGLLPSLGQCPASAQAGSPELWQGHNRESAWMSSCWFCPSVAGP